jgi:CRP-like cAMP-binding protein
LRILGERDLTIVMDRQARPLLKKTSEMSNAGSTEEALELLAGSTLCQGMRLETVSGLARHAVRVERARGESFCAEGARAESLFLLARGVVKLVRSLDSGRDVIVELVGPGEVLGEAALTDGGVYDASAICVHPSTALAVGREAAQAFVTSHPAAIRNVLALLQASLRRAHLRVEDLSIFGARQRIARFLIRLADWTGRQECGRTVVPLALSRQELAALVGTTMETTIRVMSGLRQQGLVEAARRGVVLTDRAALEMVAAGAP